MTCIGPKQDRQGMWIRLAIEEVDSDSGVGSPRSKAVWIPLQRVDKVLESVLYSLVYLLCMYVVLCGLRILRL